MVKKWLIRDSFLGGAGAGGVFSVLWDAFR